MYINYINHIHHLYHIQTQFLLIRCYFNGKKEAALLGPLRASLGSGSAS